jgi:Zn-dependent peptidase ImmA (M78 family)
VETKKLIEQFPKGNPPIQLDVYGALDYYIGLENVHEIDKSFSFTVVTDDSSYIFINKNLPYKRKHFVLAHELVEYLLEKDKPDTNLVYYLYRAQNKKLQSKVNYFASALLMPEWVIREIANDTLSYGSKLDGRFISYLSDYFSVSKTAVCIRLKTLGYEVVL